LSDAWRKKLAQTDLAQSNPAGDSLNALIQFAIAVTRWGKSLKKKTRCFYFKLKWAEAAAFLSQFDHLV
jgi:hypothetical protein